MEYIISFYYNGMWRMGRLHGIGRGFITMFVMHEGEYDDDNARDETHKCYKNFSINKMTQVEREQLSYFM